MRATTQWALCPIPAPKAPPPRSGPAQQRSVLPPRADSRLLRRLAFPRAHFPARGAAEAMAHGCGVRPSVRQCLVPSLQNRPSEGTVPRS